MTRRVFLAGAGGAIGQPLVRLLVDSGFKVFGTTRSAERAGLLKKLGATPMVLDVFDADALTKAAQAAEPEVVIHQLTDLAQGIDPARNARIRAEGTRNLVAAARAAGAARLVAQSIAWVYAEGQEPHGEDDPLDRDATGARALTVGGVVALENSVLGAAPITGVVLRYGQLYGPNTGRAVADNVPSPLHVDAAAAAAWVAVDKGKGIYNVAEPNAFVRTDKAKRELGWDAAFRLPSRLAR
jgi:nucleoside-diphosphate-sugar epimerase